MDFTEASELRAALALVKQTKSDPILQDLFSTTPPTPFLDLLIDVPVRGGNRPDPNSAPQQQQRQQQSQKMKTIRFQSNIDKENLQNLFPKVPPRPFSPQVSEMQKLFPNGGGGGGGGGEGVAPSVAGPSKKYTVFLPNRRSYPIEGSARWNVENLLSAVVELIKNEENDSSVSLAALELRVLEDSQGTPDMDFPALERSRLLADVGDDCFAVVRLTNVKDNSPLSMRVRDRKESQWSAGLKPSSGYLLKIHLPDKTSLAVQVEGAKTLTQVLQIVAKKRGLKIDDFFFETLGEGDVPENQPIAEDSLGLSRQVDMSLTVSAYGKDEVKLVQKQFADRPAQANRRRISTWMKSSSGSSVDSDASLGIDAETSALMMNRFTAGQFKEYNVIKINHHGTREERIMGIDSEHITNNMPKTGGLFGGLKSKVASIKRPQRPITDIIAAQLDSKNPKIFHITFRGDSDGSASKMRSYDFEAASESDAAEVVAKILFLRGLNNKNASGVIPEDAVA